LDSGAYGQTGNAESSGIHFVFLKEEAGIDGKKDNAVNLIIHIMSRKEETRDVGQVEIAGNFNTRFIFRKKEKVQIAVVAGIGEVYRNKKPLGDFLERLFCMYFYKVFYYFLNGFLRPRLAKPIKPIPSNIIIAGSGMFAIAGSGMVAVEFLSTMLIILEEYNAKPCPSTKKLIKNIAINETNKIKTFFMAFCLFYKSNFKI